MATIDPLIQIALPTATAAFGGIVTWFLTEWLKRKRQPALPLDLERFTGVWHGLHFTRIDPEGGCVESRHTYQLRINKHGIVTGTFEDAALVPHVLFSVNGLLSSGGLTLICEGAFKPGFYEAELYPTLVADGLNCGILAGYDYNNNPFATVILFSRHPPTRNDLDHALATNAKRFYGLQLSRSASLPTPTVPPLLSDHVPNRDTTAA